MDSDETKAKSAAYEDYDDPYAFPSAVPKNYNPDKELSDIAQKPSEMEKDEPFEEVKQNPIKTVEQSKPQSPKHVEPIKVASPPPQPTPVVQSQPPKHDNPLHSAPPQATPQPQVNSSASGSAAANLMSKPKAPAEPAKNMQEAEKSTSEHSHRVQEEGKSTCKCIVQ